MNYRELYNHINTTVTNLGFDVTFKHGNTKEFERLKNKDYPYVWLEPMDSTYQFNASQVPVEVYNVSMIFFGKDKFDSNPEYTFDVIDVMDAISRKFIEDFNDIEGIKMLNIKKSVFTVKHSDFLTGMIVTFNAQTYDTYNDCC